MELVTADLSKFGRCELQEAAELLKALTDDECDFLGDGITLNMNTGSGYVFLSDEDYNVGMLNDGKLEQWFSCPNCGEEGFKEDLVCNANNVECQEWLKEIGAKNKELIENE